MRKLAFIVALGLILDGSCYAVTFTESFDNIGNSLPPGWSLSANASGTSLGSINGVYTQAATSWGDTGAEFKNAASATGLTSGATVGQQSASTNRAFGLRQGTAFGDPGAAFNFNFSTSGVTVSNISIDLMMLSVQTRSTTFTIQYGLGTSPSSFTNLGTYSDPAAFGTTTFSFTTANFGTSLDNQSSVWFRVVALTPSGGTGTRDTVGIDNFNLISSGAINPIAIPEPATYILMGLGTLMCVQQFRRKKS